MLEHRGLNEVISRQVPLRADRRRGKNSVAGYSFPPPCPFGAGFQIITLIIDIRPTSKERNAISRAGVNVAAGAPRVKESERERERTLKPLPRVGGGGGAPTCLEAFCI